MERELRAGCVEVVREYRTIRFTKEDWEELIKEYKVETTATFEDVLDTFGKATDYNCTYEKWDGRRVEGLLVEDVLKDYIEGNYYDLADIEQADTVELDFDYYVENED